MAFNYQYRDKDKFEKSKKIFANGNKHDVSRVPLKPLKQDHKYMDK